MTLMLVHGGINKSRAFCPAANPEPRALLQWCLASVVTLYHSYIHVRRRQQAHQLYCIILYLYIYIALLTVHTNQKRFRFERPRDWIVDHRLEKIDSFNSLFQAEDSDVLFDTPADELDYSRENGDNSSSQPCSSHTSFRSSCVKQRGIEILTMSYSVI